MSSTTLFRSANEHQSGGSPSAAAPLAAKSLAAVNLTPPRLRKVVSRRERGGRRHFSTSVGRPRAGRDERTTPFNLCDLRELRVRSVRSPRDAGDLHQRK
jgi:hypothetical protein